eukprot:1364765-Pyramimonas_sp.AAC.1
MSDITATSWMQLEATTKSVCASCTLASWRTRRLRSRPRPRSTCPSSLMGKTCCWATATRLASRPWAMRCRQRTEPKQCAGRSSSQQ